MLPFLQPKKIASSVIETRKADGNVKPESETPSTDLAEKLIEAIHAKDVEAVSAVLAQLTQKDT